MILVAVAGVLALGAFALGLWALYLALDALWPAPAAAAVTGVAALSIAGGVAWSAVRLNR